MAAAKGAFGGRVALVTGAAKGIGRAVARVLCERGAAGVVLADVDAAANAAAARALAEETGARTVAVECDVSDAAAVRSAVDAAVREFGSLDVCVANAGIVKGADFLDMTEEDFDAVIDVNLKGVFLTCQTAAKQMVAQGKGGAIVTMSSVNGAMAIPTIAGYNASKGGVTNLTRCMALALAPHNIRVNAVGPGSIHTDVLQSVMDNEEKKRSILSRTPLLRIGEPSEVASVVAFLASDDASYVTGEIVYVDGGRMAMNYTVPVPP